MKGSPPSNADFFFSKRTVNDEATIKTVQLERTNKGTMRFIEETTKSTEDTDNTGNGSMVSAVVARLEKS